MKTKPRYCIKSRDRLTARKGDGHWDIYNGDACIRRLSEDEFNLSYDLGWGSIKEHEDFKGPHFIEGMAYAFSIMIGTLKYRARELTEQAQKQDDLGNTEHAKCLRMRAREASRLVMDFEITKDVHK